MTVRHSGGGPGLGSPPASSVHSWSLPRSWGFSRHGPRAGVGGAAPGQQETPSVCAGSCSQCPMVRHGHAPNPVSVLQTHPVSLPCVHAAEGGGYRSVELRELLCGPHGLQALHPHCTPSGHELPPHLACAHSPWPRGASPPPQDRAQRPRPTGCGSGGSETPQGHGPSLRLS